MKFFRYETGAFRFFAWWDLLSLGLKGLCIPAVLAGFVLYLLPSVDTNLAADVLLGAVGADFLALTVLFFTNFYTRLLQRRTQWLFCAAAGVLTCALILCVVSTGFAATSFAGVLCAVLAGLLFAVYFALPDVLAVKDLIALFGKIFREENARKQEGFSATAVYTAKKY